MISWMRRKQKYVAFSITRIEYIVTSMATCEAIWLRKLLRELFEQVLDTTILNCYKRSGIHLVENLVFHDKSKHIEIQYHSI